MDDIRLTGLYEVHNPWGETDPVSLRGLSPRLTELAGKTIGLFATEAKLAARPILEAVERKLRRREPSLEFSWFAFKQNCHIAESDELDRFKDWAKGIDAAVAAVGD
jgi:hypothetical protein